MKKIFVSTFFLVLFSSLSFAQLEDDQLLKELQKMEEQILQTFKGLGFNLEDGGMMIDTFSIKELQDLPINPEMLQFFGQSQDMERMMDMMMKGLSQMESMDLSQMEDLMRGFDIQPLIPAPPLNENGEEIKPENGEKDTKTIKKPKKKRKSYSL